MCMKCEIGKGSILVDEVISDHLAIAYWNAVPLTPIDVMIIPRYHTDHLWALESPALAQLSLLFELGGKAALKLGLRGKAFRLEFGVAEQDPRTIEHLTLRLVSYEAAPPH